MCGAVACGAPVPLYGTVHQASGSLFRAGRQGCARNRGNGSEKTAHGILLIARRQRGKLEDRVYLFPRYVELLHDLVDSGSGFEIFKHR